MYLLKLDPNPDGAELLQSRNSAVNGWKGVVQCDRGPQSIRPER